jgi:hypothetical protein
VIVWPETYKKCADLLGATSDYVMEMSYKDRVCIANEVTALAEAAKNPHKRSTAPEKVDLCREDAVSAGELVRLRDMLPDYRQHTVYLSICVRRPSATVIELPEQCASRRRANPRLGERFPPRQFQL